MVRRAAQSPQGDVIILDNIRHVNYIIPTVIVV